MFSCRPARQLIDLAAFQNNIRQVEMLAPDSELMLVIKADGYGHGLIQLAKASCGHDLAVAIPEELEVLLDAKITNRIWVLEGPFGLGCLERSADANVVWVIHSLWQLELLRSRKSSSKLKICLKLDSGMHRLGFDERTLPICIAELDEMKCIDLICTMSHFSESEVADSEYVSSQLLCYTEMLEANGLDGHPRSLANSGAIVLHPQAHHFIVRPGIMLYGALDYSEHLAPSFKAVMTFESAIMSVRVIAEGEGVGYGSEWRAERESTIATISGGYGDGYPRHAPTGTPVAVRVQNNTLVKYAPLVGRVSMDMVTIDITEIVEAEVGDKVEFWGRHVSVNEVARLAGTISYELLCGVSARVPRTYIG